MNKPTHGIPDTPDGPMQTALLVVSRTNLTESLAIADNSSWMNQGRQEHGWFGNGTGPGRDGGPDSDPGGLFNPRNVGDRTDYAARTVIGNLPRSQETAPVASFNAASLAKLRNAVTVTYAASQMTRDAFRQQFLNPYTSDASVDAWRAAAKSIVEASTHTELGAAGGRLTAAMQQIGLSQWPRSLTEMNDRSVIAVDGGKVSGVIRVGSADAPAVGALALSAAALAGLAYLFGQAGTLDKPAQHQIIQPALPSVVTADVPPYVEGETRTDILKPGGESIGKPGSGKNIRILPGGEKAAEELAGRLSKGGTAIEPGYPGWKAGFPDGDSIGYRQKSTNDIPTIDVRVKGVGIRKLRFVE